MYVNISFPISSWKVFIYKVPTKLQTHIKIGSLVTAPFGKRARVEGIVIEIPSKVNFKGKIEEIIYHGDHTRVRIDLLGNKEFILKVPNSSANMDIKMGNEINVSWNSHDARSLDPK